ncbi:MAG: WD40/YVTN/BNR-like repeat-containing protein, partial [Rhodospirillaceae bacterium]
MMTSRAVRPRVRCLAVPTLIVALFGAAGVIGGRFAGASAQGPAADPNVLVNPVMYQGLRYRNVGPHRGGRVTAISGVRQQPCTFYMGATGGGVWKTTDCGALWAPVSDGQIETGSIGSIAVAESNPDIVWAGTGSAAIRSNVIIG